MVKETVIGNETDSSPTIRKRFARLNPKKRVKSVKILKNIRGLNGTVVAKSFEVNYSKKRK